jgi:hypothetical protein
MKRQDHQRKASLVDNSYSGQACFARRIGVLLQIAEVAITAIAVGVPIRKSVSRQE